MVRGSIAVACISLFASLPLACGSDDGGSNEEDSGATGGSGGGSVGGAGGGATGGAGGSGTGGSGTGGTGGSGTGGFAGTGGSAGEPDAGDVDATMPDGGDGGAVEPDGGDATADDGSSTDATPPDGSSGDGATGGTFFDCAAGETAVELSASDLALALPDVSFTTTELDVALAGNVQSVVVRIDEIDHPFVSDLVLELWSPLGEPVTLSNRNGTQSDDYVSTVFDDSCSTPINEGTGPFTGCFSPAEALEAFFLSQSAGTWTLAIFDEGAGDTGTLQGWTLGLCVQTDPCPDGQTPIRVEGDGLPLDLDDNATTSSAAAVSTSGTVRSASVRIGDLRHTYMEDLDIQVMSPDGTTVELTSDNGGTLNGYAGTVFADACPTSIVNGAAPFSGCFAPEGDLSTLFGEGSQGTWTLQVTDDAADDVGTLHSWSLLLCVE